MNLGFLCPNRDPVTGKGGCRFCAEHGSKAMHLKQGQTLEQQVHAGIEYTHRRFGNDCGLIAYFQAYTSTFADVDKLTEVFHHALKLADFQMVIVATRPDCLPDEIIDFLCVLNASYELWLELGVQSGNDETLRRMNRGHDFQVVAEAVQKLHEKGIRTAAHVILGLPGEDRKDFLATAAKISTLPFSGVKIHNLLVLKNTPLAEDYKKGAFSCMNEYEYADALIEFLYRLPEQWPVMRICADAEDNEVIAPKWWMRKGQFITYVNERMAQLERSDKRPGQVVPFVTTGDGSKTCYHPRYRQHFHSLAGARSETEKKFLEPARLRNHLEDGGNLTLLDIGFGLGYNALASLELAETMGIGRVALQSLEEDGNVIALALELHQHSAFHHSVLRELETKRQWKGSFSSITLHLGDARRTAVEFAENQVLFDIVFLDAFSPDVNPELWSYDFLLLLKRLMKDAAVLVSYSSAYPVWGALIRAGFHVGKTQPFGRKRGGTIASRDSSKIADPLSNREMDIVLKSTSGVTYRDPGLKSSAKKINESRARLVTRLRGRGVPKWVTRREGR